MDRGFQKSWILTLLTMCLMILFSLFALIPFLTEHKYLFLLIGEAAVLIPIIIGELILKDKPEFGKINISLPLIPILMILPLCLQNFVQYLTLPFHSLIYEIFGEAENDIEAASSVKEFILQIFAVCLVPAVVEESLCRGIIMKLLNPYGVAVSITISALVFSILHFDIHSLLIIFMLGILLAAVKLMTGSLWACMLMHFSNNVIALVSIILLDRNMENILIAIDICAAVLFPFLLFFVLKRLKPDIPIIGNRKRMGFSGAMLACFVIYAAVTAANIILV